MNKQMQQLEAAMWQAAIFEIVIGAIVTVVMFYLLYLVIRAAVRDGVREGMSGRDTPGRRSPELRDGLANTMPDMRAD